MARWVRDGDAPDKVPVSFVATKANHPELVEWLWSLPFRKQSEVIRDILSEAAKMVSSGTVPMPPPVTGKPEQAGRPPAPQLTKPGVAPSEAASKNVGMTAATAAILLKQRDDF